MYLNVKKWEILFFCSPSLFLVGLNKYLSPIYPILFFSIIMILIRLFTLNKIRLESIKIAILFLLPVLMVIFSQYYFYDLKYGLLNELFRYVPSILFLVFSGSILYNKNYLDIVFLVKKFINFHIFLYVLEMFFRISKSGFSGNFYFLKYHSLLYPDSNFVALNIVVLLIFIDRVCYLGVKFQKKFIFIYKFILLFLLFFSFSRTAYLAYVIYICIALIKNYKNNSFYILVIPITLIVALFSIQNLKENIENDGSFQTKIYIFENSFNYLLSNFNIFLMGIGSGNSIDLIGRESHNFYGLMLEMGMFWALNYIFLLLYLCYLGGRNVIFVLLPVVISAFSSLLPITYMSFFYVATMLLIFLRKKRYNE